MWIRRCHMDAHLEAPLPIPTQIASNEEFIPPPQSAQQKKVAALTLAIADPQAKRHGLSRRQFLRTGSGMAAALVAMNQVFGRCFEVDVRAVRKAIKVDKLTVFKQQYESKPQPSNTQFGWVWKTEKGRRPAPPVGAGQA